MPRKLAVGLLEVQSLAMRESPRDMSKLFGKVTKKEELELWVSSCACMCGKLFHNMLCHSVWTAVGGWTAHVEALAPTCR